MRTNAFKSVSLIAAVVLGGIVQAQPTDVISGKTAKEKGEDCYYGRCEDAPSGPGVDDLPPPIQTAETKCKDCSKLTSSALLCYTCCADNGCTDVSLTWCQDFCIGLGSPWAGFFDWSDEDRDAMLDAIPAIITDMVDTISTGGRLTQTDFDWIDGALAITFHSGDTQRASWLLALLVDAYSTDQIDADDPARLWTIVGELHEHALRSTDRRFHRMGVAMLAQRGLQGRVDDRGALFVDLIIEAASQPAGEPDHLLIEAIRNF